jgi:adenosylcobinamide kinase / adenosylcobinamide-phosphate guanylyltransferase
MANVYLILGGARSGKSAFAERLAGRFGPSVLYIATAESGDEEMQSRIERHKARRASGWKTVETPLNLGAALALIDEPPDAILLDCLTLLVSNLMMVSPDASVKELEEQLNAELDALLKLQERLDRPLIIVSNEVGLGIVPTYPMGRIYRDVLGRAHQRLAGLAGRTIFMIAGIPMELKVCDIDTLPPS